MLPTLETAGANIINQIVVFAITIYTHQLVAGRQYITASPDQLQFDFCTVDTLSSLTANDTITIILRDMHPVIFIGDQWRSYKIRAEKIIKI
jgi:hypothetical protein